jgi:hypothetical protein
VIERRKNTIDDTVQTSPCLIGWQHGTGRRKREVSSGLSSACVSAKLKGALPHIWGFWHCRAISSQQEVAGEATTQKGMYLISSSVPQI